MDFSVRIGLTGFGFWIQWSGFSGLLLVRSLFLFIFFVYLRLLVCLPRVWFKLMHWFSGGLLVVYRLVYLVLVY